MLSWYVARVLLDVVVVVIIVVVGGGGGGSDGGVAAAATAVAAATAAAAVYALYFCLYSYIATLDSSIKISQYIESSIPS
jgi:NAD(P)H-hydrate repair Nnr-like enzyme with NAD(P)H-hydrate epimerase domain